MVLKNLISKKSFDAVYNPESEMKMGWGSGGWIGCEDCGKAQQKEISLYKYDKLPTKSCHNKGNSSLFLSYLSDFITLQCFGMMSKINLNTRGAYKFLKLWISRWPIDKKSPYLFYSTKKWKIGIKKI